MDITAGNILPVIEKTEDFDESLLDTAEGLLPGLRVTGFADRVTCHKKGLLHITTLLLGIAEYDGVMGMYVTDKFPKYVLAGRFPAEPLLIAPDTTAGGHLNRSDYIGSEGFNERRVSYRSIVAAAKLELKGRLSYIANGVSMMPPTTPMYRLGQFSVSDEKNKELSFAFAFFVEPPTGRLPELRVSDLWQSGNGVLNATPLVSRWMPLTELFELCSRSEGVAPCDGLMRMLGSFGSPERMEQVLRGLN